MYEDRLVAMLTVSEVCGTDKWYCNVSEWYEADSEDPLISLGDPAYTLAYMIFNLCLDDELEQSPICDDYIVSKALLVLESRGFFKSESEMVFR